MVAPFHKNINGKVICKSFGYDKIFTFKIRMKNNQTLVEFENDKDHSVELSKFKPVDILDT